MQGLVSPELQPGGLGAPCCSCLYGSSHSAAEQKSPPPNIFLSKTMCHASALLLARSFLFFNLFFPNGAFALSTGVGVGERQAVGDMLGLGDGHNTMQLFVSMFPMLKTVPAHRSSHLRLLHCPLGAECGAVNLGLGTSLAQLQRDLGQENFQMTPLPKDATNGSSRNWWWWWKGQQ